MTIPRLLVASVILAAVASTSAGCSSVGSSSGAGSNGPNGRHFFEGVVSYQGRQGAPPGRPFTATLTVKGDDFVMDLTMADGQRGAAGFHGATQTLCFKIGPMSRWIPLDLNTLALFYSLLPPSARRDAIAEAQAQYRWTGRTDRVLGRTCRELEMRSKENITTWCYSNEEFFQGDRRLIPILQKMGYDNTFISSIAEGGLGWRGFELDASGAPKMMIEATSIDARPVDPSLLAHVCDR